MIRRIGLCLVGLVVLGGCASGSGSGRASPSGAVTPSSSPAISTEWTEYHRDAGRAGLGPAEPALNGPKVAWNVAVDGAVYASPLIIDGHVIVATENNSVYSLDLFTGSVVWQVHLGDPVDSRSLPCGDIGPVTGITGTPAADPASGMLYVVAYLHTHHHMLFAMKLVDGSAAWQVDVDPSGSNPSVQQFRGALAIGNGSVYVPVGGLYGDCGAYHGYVVSVGLAGGAPRQFQVSTARGESVWSPQGVSIAPDGSVYIVTGNAVGAAGSYSNSVLQLSPDLTTVRSFFTPSNWAELNATDTDLGSVGATLMAKDYVVAIGKEGVAYLLRGGALIASRRVCSGAWGGTAWLETVVFVPCADGLYALPISTTSIDIGWRAPHPRLGSPIVSGGAVWGIEPDSGDLFALSPTDGHVLYSIGLGGAMHFSTPAATDGFVVAPAGQRVVAVSVIG